MRDVILGSFSLVSLVVSLGVLIVVVFATVDAAIRPNRSYEIVGRQSKNIWMLILGVALLATLFLGLFLKTIALVAAIVYLVDMRPKLRQVGGRGKGTGSSSGPYGPW